MSPYLQNHWGESEKNNMCSKDAIETLATLLSCVYFLRQRSSMLSLWLYQHLNHKHYLVRFSYISQKFYYRMDLCTQILSWERNAFFFLRLGNLKLVWTPLSVGMLQSSSDFLFYGIGKSMLRIITLNWHLISRFLFVGWSFSSIKTVVVTIQFWPSDYSHNSLNQHQEATRSGLSLSRDYVSNTIILHICSKLQQEVQARHPHLIIPATNSTVWFEPYQLLQAQHLRLS